MINKQLTKRTKQIDLSEYAEEAIPFDAVIRKIMSAPPRHVETPQPKKKPKTVNKK